MSQAEDKGIYKVMEGKKIEWGIWDIAVLVEQKKLGEIQGPFHQGSFYFWQDIWPLFSVLYVCSVMPNS